jgi:hypothetical protein
MTSYYLKVPIVRCDGCDDELEGEDGQTLPSVRKIGKEMGWTRKKYFGDFLEFCADCSTKT